MARIAAGPLLTLLLLAAVAEGADPRPATENAGVLSLAEGLPAARGGVRFELVLGRLRASCPRAMGQIACTAEHGDGTLAETYAVQFSGGLASTHYSVTGRGEVLTCSIGGEEARLEYERDSTPQVVLHQPAQGPVTLTWLVEGKQRRLRACTIWQLLLVAPEQPRNVVLAALRLHRRDGDIERQLAAATEALLRPELAADLEPADAREAAFRESLARIQAPTFAARREAQRRLAAAGQTAYPFLAALDPSTLDAQQRQARRELMADLAASGADSPERIALWLGQEPVVWRSLAERGTAEQQATARARLSGGIVETASGGGNRRR